MCFLNALFPPARPADHQLAAQEDLPRRQVRVLDPFQHGQRGDTTDLTAGLVNGSQRHRQQRGVLGVVETGEAEVPWDADVQFLQAAHQQRGRVIVGADHRIGLLDQARHERGIFRIADADLLLLRGQSVLGQRFAEAGDAQVHAERRARRRDEAWIPCALSQQVRRHQQTGREVVHAHQVEPAPLRSGIEIAVQEHHRDAGAFQRVHDPAVHVVLVFGQLQRREEDTVNLGAQTLLAEVHRLIDRRQVLPRVGAPQQVRAVLARLQRDFGADRLENLRIAQTRDDQAPQSTVTVDIAGCPPNKRACAGAPFDQAFELELPQRLPDRGS